jgi:hypothetical protein
MKKVGLVLFVVVMLAAGAAQEAYAQDKKVEFSLNLGVMSFYGGEFSLTDFGLTLSPQVDIHVTKGFMISPEAMFLTDIEFSGVVGFPGVIFNYVGKGFFAGAGVVLPVSISGEVGVGELLPKVNVGYRGRRVNLTLYTITSFNGIFQWGLIGASVGYRF